MLLPTPLQVDPSVPPTQPPGPAASPLPPAAEHPPAPVAEIILSQALLRALAEPVDGELSVSVWDASFLAVPDVQGRDILLLFE